MYVPGRMEELGDPVLRVLERCDRIVGDVLDRLEPGDLLLLCSDHGFQTWRWEVNLNRWLVDQGYMTLKGTVVEQNLAKFSHGGDLSADAVDWTRTRAYAMGLGQIYLNLRGREEQGIVTAQEAPALAREIRERLLEITNPYRPEETVLKDVYLLRELYAGPHLGQAPELQVGFDAGYRISWQTALLGGMGRPLIEQNRHPWSGDHCSTDVTVVPGILASNRKIPAPPDDAPYTVRDIAPTVVDFFGIDPGDLDGAPIPLGD